MTILNILPYLLCFVAGIVVGKYVKFLDKKGEEAKANKLEEISEPEEDVVKEEEDLRDYPPESVWIKRKNIAAWDENYPLNVRWKYECQNCGYESQELLEECPHCKARML